MASETETFELMTTLHLIREMILLHFLNGSELICLIMLYLLNQHVYSQKTTKHVVLDSYLIIVWGGRGCYLQVVVPVCCVTSG